MWLPTKEKCKKQYTECNMIMKWICMYVYTPLLRRPILANGLFSLYAHMILVIFEFVRNRCTPNAGQFSVVEYALSDITLTVCTVRFPSGQTKFLALCPLISFGFFPCNFTTFFIISSMNVYSLVLMPAPVLLFIRLVSTFLRPFFISLR